MLYYYICIVIPWSNAHAWLHLKLSCRSDHPAVIARDLEKVEEDQRSKSLCFLLRPSHILQRHFLENLRLLTCYVFITCKRWGIGGLKAIRYFMALHYSNESISREKASSRGGRVLFPVLSHVAGLTNKKWAWPSNNDISWKYIGCMLNTLLMMPISNPLQVEQKWAIMGPFDEDAGPVRLEKGNTS